MDNQENNTIETYGKLTEIKIIQSIQHDYNSYIYDIVDVNTNENKILFSLGKELCVITNIIVETYYSKITNSLITNVNSSGINLIIDNCGNVYLYECNKKLNSILNEKFALLNKNISKQPLCNFIIDKVKNIFTKEKNQSYQIYQCHHDENILDLCVKQDKNIEHILYIFDMIRDINKYYYEKSQLSSYNLKLNEDKLNYESKLNEERLNFYSKLNEEKLNYEDKLNEERLNFYSKLNEEKLNYKDKLNSFNLQEKLNYESKINELNIELESIRKDNQRLSDANYRSSADLKMALDMDFKSDNNDILIKSNEKLNMELESIRNDNQRLSDRTYSLLNIEEKLNYEIDFIRSDNQRLSDDNKRLSSDLKSSLNEIESIRNDNQRLSDDNGRLSSDLKTSLNVIEILKKQINERNNLIVDLSLSIRNNFNTTS